MIDDVRDIYSYTVVAVVFTLPLLFLLPWMIKPLLYKIFHVNSELRYSMNGDTYDVKAYYVFNRKVFEI